MPASVGWDNEEKTIIRQQLIGDWTFEEYMTSAKETQSLTGSMSHTVDVIVDFTASRSHPDRMLAAGPSLDRNFPSNQGLLIIIKSPAFVRAVLEVASKLYPRIGKDAHHVETLDEAYALIRLESNP